MEKIVGKFSTDIADYVLYYAHHQQTTNEKHLSGIDALVLETGFHKYEELNLGNMINSLQYTEIVMRDVTKNRKPIFFTDLPPQDWLKEIKEGYYLMTYLQSLPYIIPIIPTLMGHPLLGLGLTLPLLSLWLSLGCGYNKTYNKITSYLRVTDFSNATSYRSAVTADKIEEFIAPEISKRIGKKPTIYIEYGAGHCDIEPYLKHKLLRKSVLHAHKIMPAITTNTAYENIICELKPKEAPQPISIDKIIAKEKEQIRILPKLWNHFSCDEKIYFMAIFGTWERIYYKI